MNHADVMRHRGRGFTLVELMVSITIGLFLTGGMLTLISTMKRTTGVQASLAQFQDNARMATGLMTDVIRSTGDFMNPAANSAGAAFPALTVHVQNVGGATALSFAKGQALIGSGGGNAAAPGDIIAVRYQTSGADQLTNCFGGTSSVQATFVNIFSIDANSNLQCQVITLDAANHILSNVVATIVSNVTNLQIIYGLKTNTGVTFNSIDAYLDAAQLALMTPDTGWNVVKSVQLNLFFPNPLAGQPGQTGSTVQTLTLTRVVNVMNQVG
jgi:type IV pilus assembly protein PilW